MPATLDRVSSRKPAAKDREAYDRMQKNLTYLSESRDRLIRKYAEKWVAIYDQKVVAHADSMPKLLAALDRQNISANDVVIDFLTEEQRALIL